MIVRISRTILIKFKHNKYYTVKIEFFLDRAINLHSNKYPQFQNLQKSFIEESNFTG